MVNQPKAEIHPAIETPTAATYPITKSRFDIVPLLLVAPTGIASVMLFMAIRIQLPVGDNSAIR
jgi:hypothetical protein